MKAIQTWAMAVSLCGLLPALAGADDSLQTAVVSERQVPDLQFLDGHIEAVNKSTLSAQTSGVIEALTYDVDDLVERGSVVAKIRANQQQSGLQQARAGASEAEAGASQAQAGLGQAKAGLAEAKAGLSQARAEEQRAQAATQQAQASYQQSQAGLQEAQALLKQTQADFNRVRNIYNKRLIPRVDFDKAEAAFSTAKAKVASAQAQAESAKAAVGSARAQVDSAHSLVEAANARVGSAQANVEAAGASVSASKANQAAAQAQVQQAGENLDYTTLVAPYSGIVTERHVQLGETVNPGTPIITGISLDQMRVIVEVPQRLISRVREFKHAFVYLDGSSENLPIENMTIYPYTAPKTNAFRVRLDLEKGLDKLYPGMFVKVAFVMGEVKVLAIPKRAVAIRSEVTGVYVLDEQGVPSLRQIRLGREINEHDVSILSGLDAGEQIALDPVQAVIGLKKYVASLQLEAAQHD